MTTSQKKTKHLYHGHTNAEPTKKQKKILHKHLGGKRERERKANNFKKKKKANKSFEAEQHVEQRHPPTHTVTHTVTQ